MPGARTTAQTQASRRRARCNGPIIMQTLHAVYLILTIAIIAGRPLIGFGIFG